MRGNLDRRVSLRYDDLSDAILEDVDTQVAEKSTRTDACYRTFVVCALLASVLASATCVSILSILATRLLPVISRVAEAENQINTIFAVFEAICRDTAGVPAIAKYCNETLLI